jgi:integrase
VNTGTPVRDVTSLADLTGPEAMKTVLRHYHEHTDGKPSAFAVCLGKTIIQIAQHHTGATPDQITQLKMIAAKLPSVPFDLTDKNKALLRRFNSDHTRAAVLYLPQQMHNEVKANLDQPRLPFVKAQIGIAVDILLVAPLRPQNLSRLNWRRHFSEPDGPNGRLTLHIAAQETKTGKRELIFEIPEDVARRLRWYRRTILARLGADPEGDLFAGRSGHIKCQQTLTQQIVELIEERLGIHMTPHQFRHLAAMFYLESRPEDFETVRCLLGHAFTKTTQIYAGSSNIRASQAYGGFIIGKRDALKLKRPRMKKSRK